MSVNALETSMECVRDAWRTTPAPPVEDLAAVIAEAARRAFAGVAPIDVDRRCAGFFAAAPLLALPARAAAAYLGTYLMALLENLELQKALGLCPDAAARAHTLSALCEPRFWTDVAPHLSPAQRAAVAHVVRYLATEHRTLALSPDKVDAMLALAGA